MKYNHLSRYIAVLIILALSITLLGPLVAEACLAADIICAALKAAAKVICDDEDTPVWACILAENTANILCDLAQEYLCGSS